MKTKIKIFFIFFLLIICLICTYFFYSISNLGNMSLIGNNECYIWEPIYNLNKNVFSQQDSKDAVIEFLNKNNVFFNSDNLKVETTNIFKYNVSYYVCGMANIQSFPNGIYYGFSYPERENNTNSGPECTTITYKVQGKQIMGKYLKSC